MNLSRGSGLMKVSARLSAVGTYSSVKNWLSRCSRIIWYLTSTCFVRLWNSGLRASLMAAWLSLRRMVDWCCGYPSSASSPQIQMTSLVARQVGYTLSCNHPGAHRASLLPDPHALGPPLSSSTNPDLDLRLSTLAA